MFYFICLSLVFYLWHAFGVTIGLHRLLSHRAFHCPKFIEYFWVIGAYLAFHGSPIWWATIHRAHHKYVDTPLDPHAPNEGIFKAYAFYLPFKYADHIDPNKQSKDLISDPLYKILEQGGNWRTGYALNVAICLAFRGLLWYCFGWQVACASFSAGILALNMPLILNVICHLPHLGYRNYKIEDDSRNVWWMAVVGLGDGWHNNHHAHPASSRMGIKKWEIDPSWLLLRFMKACGLVSNINESIINRTDRKVKTLSKV
jgi:stearoyl-CoA desaturase (delta-9 desaturase)